ncbi:MAG TPA: hypothetical protein VF502_15065 [Stellaceae bacterium]
MSLSDLVDDLAFIPEHRGFGRVAGVSGLSLEVGGLPGLLAAGGHCVVEAKDGHARRRAEGEGKRTEARV